MKRIGKDPSKVLKDIERHQRWQIMRVAILISMFFATITFAVGLVAGMNLRGRQVKQIETRHDELVAKLDSVTAQRDSAEAKVQEWMLINVEILVDRLRHDRKHH